MHDAHEEIGSACTSRPYPGFSFLLPSMSLYRDKLERALGNKVNALRESIAILFLPLIK